MGRWRDAVILSRRPGDKINPAKLEELVIDQWSNVVGKDSRGLYRACEFGLNRPVLLNFDIPAALVDGIEYSKKRGHWQEMSGEYVSNPFNRSPEAYTFLKEVIAKRFSCFPLGLDFYGFMRGETEYSSSLQTVMAVTPVHVTEKDYEYHPVGACFPEW